MDSIRNNEIQSKQIDPKSKELDDLLASRMKRNVMDNLKQPPWQEEECEPRAEPRLECPWHKCRVEACHSLYLHEYRILRAREYQSR